MRKADFEKLMESIREAGRVYRGEVKPSRVTIMNPSDVKTVRKQLGLTQQALAVLIGVSVSTVRNWEQGRRRPRSSAQALLKIAKRNPLIVQETLRG